MLTSEVLGQVKRRFADESGIIIVDADIFDWINEASREIIRVTEADFQKTSALTGTTYAVNGYVTLSQMLMLKSCTYNNLPLEFTTVDELRTVFGDLTTAVNSTPLYYYLDNLGQDDTDPNAAVGATTQIKLYPSPPVDSTSIVITYIKAPTKITASTNPIDIPINFHGAVMNFCLARANERVQNWQAYGEYMDAFNESLSQNRYEAMTQEDSYPVIRDDPTLEPYWW